MFFLEKKIVQEQKHVRGMGMELAGLLPVLHAREQLRMRVRYRVARLPAGRRPTDMPRAGYTYRISSASCPRGHLPDVVAAGTTSQQPRITANRGMRSAHTASVHRKTETQIVGQLNPETKG